MKVRILCIFTIMFFSLLMLFYADGQQKAQWKGKIEIEDGVKVIKNPSEPLYGEIKFELEEDLSIGNEEDENYAFYLTGALIVDTVGNILILDRGNFRIQKFDKQGKYIQSIGRQGQGPGEFEHPSTLYLDSDDNIYVVDSGRKVHIFDKDGEFEKAITLKEFTRPIMSVTGEFGITKEGNLIAKTLSRGERKSDMPMDYDTFFNIDLINSDGAIIKTLASFRRERSGVIRTERAIISTNNLCTPRLCLCPINEDLAIYGYSFDYSLFAINSKGETVYIIKKDEPPQSITKDEKEKVIDRFMEGQKKREGIPKISRSKYESALRFPKHKPFFRSITKDDKDRIYVNKFDLPFDRTDGPNFDLFDKDGHFLYRVKIPSLYPVIKFGCFYTIKIDQETGYDKIKRYKIKNWEQIREGL